MKFKYVYFIISLIILIPGLISLVKFGLKLSIDFTGGSLIEIETRLDIPTDKISSVVASQGIEVSSIQTAGDKTYIIRTKPLAPEQNEQLKTVLNKDLEGAIEKRNETVGPTIGAELTQKAIIAVLVASICIVLYIAWAFHRIPKPYSSWKFGLSAVIALIHDVFVVTGLFSLLGHFYHVEIDALFVTALLTIIGFSVHDTIVVFDRVRENLIKYPRVGFSEIVDYSLTETLSRSLNTSFSVLLTLIALLLFGGTNIRWFVVALIVGITSGTYSSVFNASPILALWESQKQK